MRETLELIKQDALENGVALDFYGETVIFKCLTEEELKMVFSYEKMYEEGHNGNYDAEKDKIEINNDFKTNGPKAYGTFNHECEHGLHSKLTNHLDEFPKDSIEYRCLYVLKQEVQHKHIKGSAFNINFEGDSYIDLFNVKKVFLAENDLIEAMYSLQLSERNAFIAEQKACELVLSLCEDAEYVKKHLDLIKHKQDLAVDVIRKEFNVEHLSYKEICKVVDKAKENIIYGKSPTKNNDFEAAVTYKMILMLHSENIDFQNANLYMAARQFYVENNLSSAMEKSMNTSYGDEGKFFVMPGSPARVGEYVFVNDLAHLIPGDELILHELTQSEQERNPDLIVSALKVGKHKALAEIKNESVFKLWYYSDNNKLSQDEQEFIAELMGNDYSPEIRLIRNKELNEILKNAEQEVENSYNNVVENICYQQTRQVQNSEWFQEEGLDVQDLNVPKGPWDD
jgi:hypothetical protein